MPTLVACLCAYLAAKIWGYQVGYQYFSHDPNQAIFYGYLTAGMGGLLAGAAVVWPIVRYMSHTFVFSPIANVGLNVRRSFGQQTAVLALDDDTAGDNEFATILYRGLVDRDFHYDSDGLQKKRIRCQFEVRRNMAAMAPRECEAAKILQALERMRYVNNHTADKMRFALCWGDGAGAVGGSSFKASPKLLKQIGVSSISDLVSLEARHRNANCQGAINELFGMLPGAANSRNATAEIKKLYQGLSSPGGQQWRN